MKHRTTAEKVATALGFILTVGSGLLAMAATVPPAPNSFGETMMWATQWEWASGVYLFNSGLVIPTVIGMGLLLYGTRR